MEPFIPFASPYLNGLPPRHYDGNYDYHDDSGYESEDPEIVPSPSHYPNHVYEETNQDHHDPPWTWHHQATAFVNAQWSPPTTSRACHLHHGSTDDSRRSYDLPQPLSFEQQCNYHESDHQRTPSKFHSHENFGRNSSHTPSWGLLEENISPLDFEEHKARIPDALPSLHNRIERESDESLPPRSSTRHGCPSPEAKPNVPRTRRSPSSTHLGYRTEILMPLSAGRPHRHQTTSSRDAQLATAWQQHYHEPMILEKKRRAALRKKEPESLQQRREWPRSSRGDYWDDADDEGYSRSYDGDGMANGEYAG